MAFARFRATGHRCWLTWRIRIRATGRLLGPLIHRRNTPDRTTDELQRAQTCNFSTVSMMTRSRFAMSSTSMFEPHLLMWPSPRNTALSA